MPLASWRDTSSFPAPKARFLARSVLLRTWALKTASKVFGNEPLSAVAQQLCTHWATYQALLISRLSRQTPLGTDIPLLSHQQQIFCTFRHRMHQKWESQSSRWKTEPLLKAPSLKANISTISVASHPGQPRDRCSSTRAHRWAGPRRGQRLRRWQLCLCKVRAGYWCTASLIHCVQLKWSVTNEERHFTHTWCTTQTSSWLILFLFASV